MLRNIKTILEKKDFYKIYLIFIGGCVAACFEILSLGLIVPIVSVIVQPDLIREQKIIFVSESDTLIQNIPFENIKNIFIETNKNNLLFFLSIFVFGTFLVKNLYLTLLLYYENKFYFTLRKNTASKIFSYYLNSPYLFHLNRNPAHLSRNITHEITQSLLVISFLNSLLRESLIVIAVLALLRSVSLSFNLSFALFIANSARSLSISEIFSAVSTKSITLSGLISANPPLVA